MGHILLGTQDPYYDYTEIENLTITDGREVVKPKRYELREYREKTARI